MATPASFVIILYCLFANIGDGASEMWEDIERNILSDNDAPYLPISLPLTTDSDTEDEATRRIYRIEVNGSSVERTYFVVRTYPPLYPLTQCSLDEHCPLLPEIFCFMGECVVLKCNYGYQCPSDHSCVNSLCQRAEENSHDPCYDGGDCSSSAEGARSRMYEVMIDGRFEKQSYLIANTYQPVVAADQCTQDSHCPQLLEIFCFGGECVEMICRSSSQCPPYHRCVNSRCRRTEYQCNAFGECSPMDEVVMRREYLIMINGRFDLKTYHIVRMYPPINFMPYCTKDTHCPNRPQIFCFAGDCVEMKCKNSQQCPPRHACRRSRCQRAKQQIEQQCNNDADCPSTVLATCVENICRELGQTCSGHSDCPNFNGVYCVDKRCVKLGQQCSNSQPCPFPASTICAESTCFPNNLQCNSTSDCPSANMLCKNSICVLHGTATTAPTTRPTPTTTTTTLGTKPPLPPPTTTTPRPPPPTTATTKTAPTTTAALTTSATDVPACSGHSDCPTADGFYCVDKRCEKLGQQCSSSQPCPFPASTVCVESTCMPNNLQCNSSSDCPSTGMWCKDSICVLRGTATIAPTTRPPATVATTTTGAATPTRTTPPTTTTTLVTSTTNVQACSVHSDCSNADGFYCMDKHCVQLGQQCSSSQPCPFPDNTLCAGSTCLPNNLQCNSNSDCPSRSMWCKNSICVVRGTATTALFAQPPSTSIETTPTTTTTSTTSTTTTTTTRSTTTTSPPPKCRTPDDAKEEMLQYLNRYRSTIALGNFANGTADSKLPTAANMNELRWDCELESSAYKYAKSCSLTKSDPSTRPDVGEGVFIMVGNNTAKSMVVQALSNWWTDLMQHGLQGLTFTKAYEDSITHDPWAQSAWAKTTKIGCYMQNCPPSSSFVPFMDFLVCRYSKRGNIIGEPIYLVGPTCSKCGIGYTCIASGHYKGLCSPLP